MIAANIGRKRPDVVERNKSKENRKKVSDTYLRDLESGKRVPLPAWNKGMKNPNLSERNKQRSVRGSKNPMFGKPPRNKGCMGLYSHSNEVRERISKLRLGSDPWNKGKSCPQLSGENNPSWKGGVSFEPYCPKFNRKFRKRVRAFFNHKCVACGMTQEENGKDLSVHHVHYDKKTCCKEGEDVKDRKFVALCKSHHADTNNNRAFWEDWYTEIINEFYGGQCYFTEEEMAEMPI